jgi:hypothetical protein
VIKRRQPYKSFGGGITKFIRSKAACLQAPVMYSVKVVIFKVFYFRDVEHILYDYNITKKVILRA